MSGTPGRESARTPVHILTGFLGSGKTTLLRHLLSDPALHDTAVVINEFGEVGLDHLLVRKVAEDVVLLGSGCVCCTVRDDLVSTLANLHGLAAEGDIPGFSRLIIETTGLADPVPISEAVLSEPRLTRSYRLGTVVTTVDAVAGAATLTGHETAAIQVAVSDHILLTKTDMVDADLRDSLHRQIRKLNETAPVGFSALQRMPAADVLFKPETPALNVLPASGHVRVSSDQHHNHEGNGEGKPGHADNHAISTFTVTFEPSVHWADFVDWIELLLGARGDSVLRVKGLLAVTGDDKPRVVQGVQHVLYPADRLDAWPGQPGRSWLVFIARNLTKSAIERSLREFLRVTPIAT